MMMEMGHGGHMIWMLVPVLLVIAIAGFIGFQLRPASQAAMDRLRGDIRLPSIAQPNATPASAEPEDMLIVIPDISGYTQFMSMSRLALAHAHYVIAELLTAILEAGGKTFQPMRLEGDAVVFYARSKRLQPQEAGQGLIDIMHAFDARLQSLAQENACICKACKHIGSLDLKIIVHHGEALQFQMGGMEDLSGEAIIVAHRLLKNSVGQPRYILVTDETNPLIAFTHSLPSKSLNENLAGVGKVPVTVYELPHGSREEQEANLSGSALPEKARDFVRKIRVSV